MEWDRGKVDMLEDDCQLVDRTEVDRELVDKMEWNLRQHADMTRSSSLAGRKWTGNWWTKWKWTDN